jgi:hypothetical protein
MLKQSPTQGRAVLQRVIVGRIAFTPMRDAKGDWTGYAFSAETRYDALFEGAIINRNAEFGTDRIEGISPDDTMDGEYGRMLAKALGIKGGAPGGTRTHAPRLRRRKAGAAVPPTGNRTRQVRCGVPAVTPEAKQIGRSSISGYLLSKIGRDGGIRTHDPLTPSQVR